MKLPQQKCQQTAHSSGQIRAFFSHCSANRADKNNVLKMIEKILASGRGEAASVVNRIAQANSGPHALSFKL